MYLCGVSDIVLGAAFAFLFPEVLGEDPEIYRICGGLVALLGLPMFWLGYRYGREPQGKNSSSQVFRTRD